MIVFFYGKTSIISLIIVTFVYLYNHINKNQ